MGDYAGALQAALVAHLVADAPLAALIGGRVVDEPGQVALPYLQIASLDVAADDTDLTTGATVQVGLVIRTRPAAGKTEAQAICGAAAKALHRRPEALNVAPFTISEIEVQTWMVQREGDGLAYTGRLAALAHMDTA